MKIVVDEITLRELIEDACFNAIEKYKQYEQEQKENRKKDKNEDNTEIKNNCEAVITYLNTVTHSNFKNTKAHDTLIAARFKDGYTLEDFKNVIDMKNKEWGTDKTMNKYLRPATLFAAKNFASYAGLVVKEEVINEEVEAKFEI